MKATVIIQARMGSSRLPGKVLLPLGKSQKPALQHLIERVKRAHTIDKVLLVTTDLPEDNILEEYALTLKCNVWRGKSKYVLDNILEAIECMNIDTVVDVTADCPLIDPKHIDKMVKCFYTSYDTYTYVSNVINRSYPRGFDLQVYRGITLKLFSDLITDPNHRNHSGWNIMTRENVSRQLSFIYGKDYQDWRLCIDEIADYRLMSIIFDNFKNNKFSAEDVIKFLEEKPHLLQINNNVKQKIAGKG